MAELIPPRKAAKLVGIDEAKLRLLAQDEYFGPFLEAPRNHLGYRSYTERDVAVLRYIVQMKLRTGMTYPQIRQNLESRGVEQCLKDALGAEGTLPVLEQRLERLKNDLAVLMREREDLLRQRDEYQQRLHDAQQRLHERELVVERLLAAATVFVKEHRQKATEIVRSINAVQREVEEAEAQYIKALSELRMLQEKLSTFWGRLLLGGIVSARLAEALVRLEVAQQQYRRSQEDLNRLLKLAEEWRADQLLRAIGAPDSEAIEVTVIERENSGEENQSSA